MTVLIDDIIVASEVSIQSAQQAQVRWDNFAVNWQLDRLHIFGGQDQ